MMESTTQMETYGLPNVLCELLIEKKMDEEVNFEWAVSSKAGEMEIRLVWRTRGADGGKYGRNKAYKSPGALRRDNDRLK